MGAATTTSTMEGAFLLGGVAVLLLFFDLQAVKKLTAINKADTCIRIIDNYLPLLLVNFAMKVNRKHGHLLQFGMNGQQSPLPAHIKSQ